MVRHNDVGTVAHTLVIHLTRPLVRECGRTKKYLVGIVVRQQDDELGTGVLGGRKARIDEHADIVPRLGKAQRRQLLHRTRHTTEPGESAA